MTRYLRVSYYDGLMQNAGYPERAEYLCALLRHFHHEPGETLDLACGTGTLTLELKKRGFSILASMQVSICLPRLKRKRRIAENRFSFSISVCSAWSFLGRLIRSFATLDSLNHLATPQDVQETFVRVARYLRARRSFCFSI